LARIDKTLEMHELRLKLLEDTQGLHEYKINDLWKNIDEHIKDDTPLSVEVGKWSTRVIWASLTAIGGLIVAYIYKLFGVK
jgi:hypothetical protein